MQTLSYRTLYVLLALAWSGNAVAELSEEDELARVYGDKSTISLATGSRQLIARAPAVATVVTAQDIEAMGAPDFPEVRAVRRCWGCPLHWRPPKRGYTAAAPACARSIFTARPPGH